MADLISRKDALREARPEYLNPQQEKLASYNQGWNNALDEYFFGIKELPSADAVEVVRCKDCKWYMQKQKNLPYNVTKRYCNRTCTLATKEDDYCSYGERRKP